MQLGKQKKPGADTGRRVKSQLGVESEIERLGRLKDGTKIYGQLKKLAALGGRNSERRDALNALLAYAESGVCTAHRTSAMELAIPLLNSSDVEFEPQLRKLLSYSETAYWALEALPKVMEARSYPILSEYACDDSHEIEERAKAIIVLCDHAGLPWASVLPSDPGYWTEEDLPFDALKDWLKQPQQSNHKPILIRSHADLSRPKSELDYAVQQLDSILARQLKDSRSATHRRGRILPGDPASIKSLQQRWKLPGVYVRFLKKFSPHEVLVSIARKPDELQIFGAHELETAQHGYSYNPLIAQPIDDWPINYIVIAAIGGDPFVLDLNQAAKGDAPVLTAKHGLGTWKFRTITTGFVEFLRHIVRRAAR